MLKLAKYNVVMHLLGCKAVDFLNVLNVVKAYILKI